MTVATRVFISFPTTTPGLGDDFRMDDAVLGVLDGEGVLGGLAETRVDVTDDVRSVTVRRGRSFQLEQFQAGQSTVVLSNNTRDYDPTNGLATATRVNLVQNPSFETDTAGWSASALSPLTTAGASLSRTLERSMFGDYSACLQTSASGEGAHYLLPGLSPNTTYVVSAYVYGWTGAGVTLTTRDVTNGVAGTTSVTASAGDWTRITSTLSTGASTATGALAFISQGASATALIDAVVAETASAGYYFDGSVADGRIVGPTTAWTGTAHASTSSLTYSILGTGSPYFPSVRPRVPLAIETNGSAVFTGKVEDWDFDYNVTGDSVAIAKSADGYSELARTEIDSFTASVQTSGARINSVLDLAEVNWPASLRNIDTGDVTLASASITAPTNTLEYLRDIEQAEFGALFVDKSGLLNFNERTSNRAYTSVAFSDNGGIPFTDIQVAYGTEQIKNRVTINRPGGSLITVDDTQSIADFGVISYDLPDTLLEDDGQATDLATLLVERYAQPALRITRIGVDLRAITAGQVSSLLDLELGDVVTVTFTPNRVGDPISQPLIIDAIEHQVSVQGHRLAFDLSQTDPAFVLDSLVWGVLDDDKL